MHKRFQKTVKIEITKINMYIPSKKKDLKKVFEQKQN